MKRRIPSSPLSAAVVPTSRAPRRRVRADFPARPPRVPPAPQL